jgi:TolB-like protein/DNA-binding winged helix-turn-helix (wHTH) protein/Flp pilus assembly protein TadD
LRFGPFEADLGNRQLFKNGIPVSLRGQPFDVLALLLEHPGELVTREQLRARLWPSGTIVEFDHGIHGAVTKLRDVLGQHADYPRFIETVPRHGYRFIAPVSMAVPAAPKPVMDIGSALPAGSGIDVPPSLKETKKEDSPNVQAGSAAMEAATVSSPSATSSAPPRPATWGPLGWIGGTLIIVTLLAASWASIHYRGVGKPAERTSSGAAAAIHSLAVLPLENLSGDKEQEYFADGVTDALTTDLAQIGSLRVISRTSAMQFKGSKETLPQIGRDLKVDAVVEGAVTRGENRVRVTAQLVEASSDHHLWARTYERDLKDVLALQDEIAQDIAEQIRVKLTPKERSLLIQVHTVDPEAYDAYVRGRYWAYKQTLEGGQNALGYYQEAIAKDPGYALAYAGLAEVAYKVAASTGDALSRKEGSARANKAAIKALALDPSLAEPHSSLAYIKLFNDWDFSGAEAEFKQAIALNPSFAEAHRYYSIYLIIMERLDEAVKESERACDLDPFNYNANQWLGQALYHARRYDDALRQIRRTLDMFPDRPDRLFLYDQFADVYEQKKMFAEAFAARQQGLSVSKDPNVTALVKPLSEAYKRAGYRGYLLKKIQILEQEPHRLFRSFTFPLLAHMYAMLDDEAHAMSYLERAYAEHNGTIHFVRTAPELDSIRSSPRFRDLVRRIGFPQPSSDKN